MKIKEPKTPFLSAFHSKVDLGPNCLVCQAQDLDVEREQLNKYALDDNDSVEMPAWMFASLNIRVGEPLSVTVDPAVFLESTF